MEKWKLFLHCNLTSDTHARTHISISLAHAYTSSKLHTVLRELPAPQSFIAKNAAYLIPFPLGPASIGYFLTSPYQRKGTHIYVMELWFYRLSIRILFHGIWRSAFMANFCWGDIATRMALSSLWVWLVTNCKVLDVCDVHIIIMERATPLEHMYCSCHVTDVSSCMKKLRLLRMNTEHQSTAGHTQKRISYWCLEWTHNSPVQHKVILQLSEKCGRSLIPLLPYKFDLCEVWTQLIG